MIKLLSSVKAVSFVKALRDCKKHFNLLFIFAVGFVALLILFGNRNSVYSIKGTTQTITLATSSNQLNQWVIEAGSVFTMSSVSCDLELNANNALELSNNLQITITTEKMDDKLSYLLVARSDGNNVASINSDSKICDISDYLELNIDADQALTLPFEAITFIGEDVGTGVDKLLIDGSVNILEKQFFSSKRYIGETLQLNMGDRVRLAVDNPNESASAKGFVRFIDNSNLYFSVTSQADSVLIERFGSSTLTITPSIWSRITNDPIVAALGSLFALLFLLIEFFMAFNQIFKKDGSSNE
jgi:hypothetical protein